LFLIFISLIYLKREIIESKNWSLKRISNDVNYIENIILIELWEKKPRNL
jgi:hypothetical protein